MYTAIEQTVAALAVATSLLGAHPRGIPSFRAAAAGVSDRDPRRHRAGGGAQARHGVAPVPCAARRPGRHLYIERHTPRAARGIRDAAGAARVVSCSPLLSMVRFPQSRGALAGVFIADSRRDSPTAAALSALREPLPPGEISSSGARAMRTELAVPRSPPRPRRRCGCWRSPALRLHRGGGAGTSCARQPESPPRWSSARWTTRSGCTPDARALAPARSRAGARRLRPLRARGRGRRRPTRGGSLHERTVDGGSRAVARPHQRPRR